MDQGPPHKTRYTESNRSESREKYQTHGHRGKVPEDNTNGLYSKIKNQQMGPHKIAKVLQNKGYFALQDSNSRTKQQPTDWKIPGNK